MTDQTDVAAEKKPEKPPEVAVTFSTPDEWTIEHYTRYAEAKVAAATKLEWVAKYQGALALIKVGFVQVRCDNAEVRAKVMKMLELEEGNQGSVSSKFMGFVVRNVAQPLETSVYIDPNW